MIIDSHCHLNYEPISSSIREVVKRAKQEGIDYLLTISTNHKTYSNIIDIITNHNEVYGTYGIHPHEAKEHVEIKSLDIIKNIKKSNKIIGIGETGLDFFYNHSDKKAQINLFLEHIRASKESKLPLIIHTRSAEKETFEILKSESRNQNLKILIHCFTGSKEFAHKLLDLG